MSNAYALDDITFVLYSVGGRQVICNESSYSGTDKVYLLEIKRGMGRML